MIRLLAFVLLASTALAQDVHVRVDPNGPGSIDSTTDYKTIQNALDHAPEAPHGRIIISIVPGVYHERINVTRLRPRVTLLGLGEKPEDVVITASQNAKSAGGTYFTETVQINGDDFEADNITFENTAGNTGQAVAAAVRSDRAVFKHCRFLGDQDTLFADFGRQYYVDSYIQGGVDFIFGNATAVFDHDEIHAIRPGYLTAQSRTSPDQTTGYVIINSRITSEVPLNPPAARPQTVPTPLQKGRSATTTPAWNMDPGIRRTPPSPQSSMARVEITPHTDGTTHLPSNNPEPTAPAAPSSERNTFYLGRPWRLYSRVIVSNTELPDTLNPKGWSTWKPNDTTFGDYYYAEYNNSGPGWKPAERASWSHQLTPSEARQYEPQTFLRGKDRWNPIAEAAKLP